MNAAVKTKFAVKPVVAALALALPAVSAYADPTPLQMPGAGLIRAVSAGTIVTSPGLMYIVGGGGVAGGAVVAGSPGPAWLGSLQLTGAGTARAVIQWGGAGAPIDSFNPAGFNIGSQATMWVTTSAGVTNGALLNIDASGNASQIMGQLVAYNGANATICGGACGAAPAIYVANANGIIVGQNAYIQAPSGLGLIGANLTGATAVEDFVGNNSTGVSYLNVNSGQANVTVHGAVDGGGVVVGNPAAFVLLAGGDIVNTGNVFGSNVAVVAGMRPVTTLATVAAVTGTSVNRLWSVDSNALAVGYAEGTLAGNVQVAKTGSSFVNTGTLTSKNTLVLPANNSDLVILAAKGITSGVAGSTDMQSGRLPGKEYHPPAC